LELLHQVDWASNLLHRLLNIWSWLAVVAVVEMLAVVAVLAVINPQLYL
jgi:hypothetical protein